MLEAEQEDDEEEDLKDLIGEMELDDEAAAEFRAAIGALKQTLEQAKQEKQAAKAAAEQAAKAAQEAKAAAKESEAAAAKAAAEAAEAEMEAAWSELEAALGLKESIDLERALSIIADRDAEVAAKDQELADRDADHAAKEQESARMIAQLQAQLAAASSAPEGVPPE